MRGKTPKETDDSRVFHERLREIDERNRIRNLQESQKPSSPLRYPSEYSSNK
jgi:hypothetical protein